MTVAEYIWAFVLLGGAIAMAVFTVCTWSRGWIRDEDGETHHRSNNPRSFAAMQVLQIVSMIVLLTVGIRALEGWK